MTFKRWFNKDKKEKLELGLGEVLLEELYNEKCEIEKKYVSGISEITRQKNYVNFYKAANNNKEKEIKSLKKEVLEVRQHLELTEREWGKDTVKLYHFKTQLNKAKEIIKELINIINYLNEDEYGKEDFPTVHKAEQFLQEIEK